MNTYNLNRLCDYLLSGRLAATFNMTTYSEEKRFETTGTTCGAVGCAVGHGPYVAPDMIKKENENWNEYCTRIFDITSDSDEWNWCFGSDWSEFDNTPEGAAKRIKYILSGNEIPRDYFTELQLLSDCEEENPGSLEAFVGLYKNIQ